MRSSIPFWRVRIHLTRADPFFARLTFLSCFISYFADLQIVGVMPELFCKASATSLVTVLSPWEPAPHALPLDA
jgi:hypothetical protein